MRVLVDTNILTCLAQPAHPRHALVLDALAAMGRRGDEPCVVPQNIYEFWAVCSRPREHNGLGFSTPQTEAEVAKVVRLFPLVRDERAIFERWKTLVVAYDVRGKNAHDARLVAAAVRHGWKQLFTLNDADFRRYREIEVVTPESVLTAAGGA